MTIVASVLPAPTILWGTAFVDNVAASASVLAPSFSYVLPILMRVTYAQPNLDTKHFALGR